MQPVQLLNDADNAALAELFERYAPALLTHLRLNVQSAEDAEDLLLDIFSAALERDSLRGLSLEEQRFWLWRVARNKLVDYYRRRSVRRHVRLADFAESIYQDDELAPEWLALRGEEYRDVLEEIKKLPRQQQEVLLLRFAYGLRTLDIARILGKQNSAIRSTLSRTLNRLRKTFEKRLG